MQIHSVVGVSGSGLDETILKALNLVGTNPILDRIMIFFTTLSAFYVIFLFVIPLWVAGQREATFDLFVILGITIVLTEVIKFAVGRPRPCELPDVHTIAGFGCAQEIDPSFPSGHASRAFALAALVAIRYRWRAGIPASAFAVLAGISRIYLGVHWPSDVLGGAVLGIGVAVLIEILSQRLVPYQRIRGRILRVIPHLPRRAAPP